MNAQFASILSARILANVLQAINVIVLARAVSPSDIGMTSAIIGFCMVLFTITDFGLSTLISKSYAREDHVMVASALRWTTITTWVFGLSALGVGLGLSALHLIPLSMTALILSVAVDRCVEYRLSVPIAAESKAVPASSILLRRGVQFIVFVGFVIAGVAALWAYALAQLLGALVGYLQSTYFLRTRVVKVENRLPWRTVLKNSYAFFVNSVTAQISTLDTFLVSVFSGAHSAGLYAAASRVTSPLILIPGTLASTVLPPAARATASQARRVGVRLILLVPAILLLAGPVGYFVAEPLCQLLYGPEYRPAGLTLTVLFIGIPFAVLAAALGAILQAQGGEQFVAKVGVGFAVVFVSAIGVGGHLYGSVGAAIGGCTAMALNCVPLVVRVLRLEDPPEIVDLDGLGGAELTPTRASAD
ncbi:oligosaccharide flippase family protein [Mycolicibacterium arenosum]|uniref:Oligosaccharide flippase family protein n=1 Tax=Mycolicibacterium arenosum TaxID=2952157 RepID=A0ABT1M786_9MYCO|nr:oligosaccharide flippase family protein [Mycolicibacterium sp. CAU 1645]MCP9274277.1 oligosaccharide flippase family protein [Mycolicibacterium sp. CAU 1645]